MPSAKRSRKRASTVTTGSDAPAPLEHQQMPLPLPLQLPSPPSLPPPHYNHQQLIYHHQHFYTATDVELVNDFCAFLEHRVVTKNVSLLRRMLLEFYAHRQEHTLAQFKCFGANLVAVLPFDHPDEARRRHAAQLLQKPKHALVNSTCAFGFLFTRVASKNLATLKQIFFEFCKHDESALAAFVKRGIAAVSVIPYEPSHSRGVDQQFAYSAYGPTYGNQPVYLQHYHPPPQHHGYPPPLPYQQQVYHQSFCGQAEPVEQTDEYGNYQQEAKPANGDSVPGVTPKHERAKKIATAHRKSHPSQDLSARSPIARDGSNNTCKSNTTRVTMIENSASPVTSVAVVTGKRVVKKPVRYYNEQGDKTLIAKTFKRAKKEPPPPQPQPQPESEPKAVAPPTAAKAASPRGVKARKPPVKKQKGRRVKPVARFSDDDESYEDDHVESDSTSDGSTDSSALKKHTPSTRTIDSMIEAALLHFQEQPIETHAEKLGRENEKLRQRNEKRRQKRAAQAAIKTQAQAEACEGSEFPMVRWTRQDDVALQLKLEVRNRLRSYEALEPWLCMFHGGSGGGGDECRQPPLPFDEHEAPRLAEKLRNFWKTHARTVWERRFWMPLAQDGDSKENVQRKARQQIARHLFDAIIYDAHAVFGAQFFVRLDEQHHPGWWYRGPIVDILAYHKVVGEEKCWEYVEKQLYERFPDCGLQLPLKSPNYGVLLRHRSESNAMWSNTVKAQRILTEIVALKTKQRRMGGGSSPCSSEADTTTTNSSSSSSDPSEASSSGSTMSKQPEGKDGEERANAAVQVAAREVKMVVDGGEGAPAGGAEGDGGHEVALTLAAGGNVEDDGDDDDNEMDEDDKGNEEEKLLIEKIALASSLKVDSFKPTTLAPSKETMATADSVGQPAASAENGGEVTTTLTAPASGDAKDASVDANILEKELEPAHFAEFIRKISPFDDNGDE